MVELHLCGMVKGGDLGYKVSDKVGEKELGFQLYETPSNYDRSHLPINIFNRNLSPMRSQNRVKLQFGIFAVERDGIYAVFHQVVRATSYLVGNESGEIASVMGINGLLEEVVETDEEQIMQEMYQFQFYKETLEKKISILYMF